MIGLLVRDVVVPDEATGQLSSVDVHVDRGRIVAIVPHADQAEVDATTVVDGSGAWLTPPYVEPHVHLDAALTAGQPRWNRSGTLWEGIACWSERKPMLTREDVIGRAEQTLRWYAANGTLHVRSHVDVTDPSLVALDALLEVRDRVRDVIDLQLVAFPQEGICSFPDGQELLTDAARRGVDAVGAIPHYEDTREDGVRVGGPANFLLLPASDGYDAVRRQVRPTHVVSHGRVVATTPPSLTTLSWPGEEPAEVTFSPATP